MERLHEYLAARMPEHGSRQKTVTCKFYVGCAQMLIASERRTFDMDEISLWLKWVRKQREGKTKDREILPNDEDYGIETWKVTQDV